MLSIFDAIIGRNVIATSKDAIREKVITSPISLNTLPVIPSTKIIGTKTITVVNVDAVIDNITSFVPNSAACTISMPS